MPNPLRRPSNLVLGLAAPLLLILLQTPVCFTVDGRPETDINTVGDTHRIRADVDAGSGDDWVLIFEVLEGPNTGVISAVDEITDEIIDTCSNVVNFDDVLKCITALLGSECVPSCIGSGDGTVSWSYKGRGGPGTDLILMCAFDLRSLEEVIGPNPMASLKNGGVSIAQRVGISQTEEEELSDEEIEELESLGCDVVTKKWVKEDDNERRPNVGGVFAGDLDAAQRNRERASASAVVATAPRAAEAAPIRPPSTGDGGLID